MKSEYSKIVLPLVVDSRGDVNGGTLIKINNTLINSFTQENIQWYYGNLPANVNVSKTCATKMLVAFSICE
jgi:hypothetical protein